jgi:predicted RNA polymerase sigma factor
VDDELRLIFLCCHPELSRAAQVALTLRIGFGFTTAQIARAFLSEEKTVAQRIVRAKQRLRDLGVVFEIPDAKELPSRLDSSFACGRCQPALAVAMLDGAAAGIDELDAIPERELIARYPYALAAYAELHASVGNLETARSYLDRALERQPSPAERRLLARKHSALGKTSVI